MKNLTYEIYLANPEIRDEIERAVRRARAEAFNRYLIAPLIDVFSGLFKRAASERAHVRLNSAQEVHCG